ncbi:MAG: pyrroline-5-carboxylate reductase [Candidatus Pelagibacter sp. TMED118]|nr:MAG: pyrroline-5-carboxylate reductase [Candidatus Pelagibacter sp. TMED118]|tara:strand:- start:2944 stop:3708 length:765 start_codon:yes stop_codon:yes gene_type:complete
MKLGFIGTGEITKSVVIGILKSKINYKNIYLSKRNKKISAYLKKKNKKIIVSSSNQEIVNKSDWVFLAVTPLVGMKILKNLKFKQKQYVISFISTIKMSQLKKLIKSNCKIIRAIPLPPIEHKVGPIPIFPPNNQIKKFFNKLGTTIEIKNEMSSLNYWATSSLMAPFFEILNISCKWLIKRGVNETEAKKYVTSLFFGLAVSSIKNNYKDLDLLVKHSQTSKGLNEQTLKFLKNSRFYSNLSKSLDKILIRLK